MKKTKLLGKGLTLCLIVIALLTFVSCDKEDKPKPPADAAVEFTSFAPETGAEGATVKLAGKNFSSNTTKNTVTFNGKAATVTSVNTQGTELMVTVPDDATSGKIVVTVGDKTVTSLKDFIVNPAAPTISAMNPDNGQVGTVVTLTGTNFKTGATKVFFNGAEVPATDITVTSKTSLTAKVPTGASTGTVKVVTGLSLEAISSTAFYLKPTIAAFTPTSAKEQEVVTITGTNFSTDVAVPNIVKFGTVSVTSTEVQVVSTTQLKVKVPAGVSTTGGKVSVSVKEQVVESTDNFTVIPTLTSYTPDHGPIGSTVALTGKSIALDARVFIGTIEITAFETGRTTSHIEFKVPAAATGGTISIMQNGISYSFGNYTVTNIWIKRSNGFSDIYEDGVYFAVNGKIYMGLGRNSGTGRYNTNFKVYDPAVKSWSDEIPIPAGMQPRIISKSVVYNNNVYLGTGVAQGGIKLKDWWEFNPANATWVQRSDYPIPSLGGIAFTINNRIFGGLGRIDRNDEIPLYEYEMQGWSPTPSYDFHSQMGQGGWIESSVFVLNGIAYIGAGSDWNAVSRVHFYRFDPSSSSSLQRIANFPIETQRAPAYSLNDIGYVVKDSKAYQYNPTTNIWTTQNLPIQVQYAAALNNKAYIWTEKGVLYEFIPNY